MRRVKQKLKQTKRTFSNLDVFMKSQKIWHQISPIILWKMKEATYTVRFEPGYRGGSVCRVFWTRATSLQFLWNDWKLFCGRRRQTSNKRKPNEKTTTYWAEIENSWTEIENSWMRLKILEIIHFLHLYKWCVDWDKNSNKRKEHSQTLMFSWNHKKFGIKSPP